MVQSILVVEDDDATADVIRYVLEDEGYLVDVAGCAEEALQTRVPPSVILFDLNLGTRRGEVVADLLRSSAGRSIPLVAMSVDPDAHRRVRERPGVVALLRKPFDLDTLVDIVNALVRSSSQPSRVRAFGTPLGRADKI